MSDLLIFKVLQIIVNTLYFDLVYNKLITLNVIAFISYVLFMLHYYDHYRLIAYSALLRTL